MGGIEAVPLRTAVDGDNFEIHALANNGSAIEATVFE